MATLFRKKNIFQKLAPLWAALTAAAHSLVCWYVYFGSQDLDLIYRYELYLRYPLWLVCVVILTVSFCPNSTAELAKQFTIFLTAYVAGCGAIYFWAQNYFRPDTQSLFWQLYSQIYNTYSYSREMFVKIALNSLGIVFIGGLFCAFRLGKNNSDWLRKHTY